MSRTPVTLLSLLLLGACEYNTTNLYQENFAPDGGTASPSVASAAPPDAGENDDMATGIRAANIAWGRTVQVPSSFDVNNPAVRKIGAEQRVAEIDVSDEKVEQVTGFTVYLASSFRVSAPSPGIGPLTGILQWGRGGAALQRMEFDIPIVGNTNVDTQGTNGVAFQVPGTSFILSARNDANAGTTEFPAITVLNNFLTSALINVPEVQGFIQRGGLNKLTATLTRTIYLTDMVEANGIANGAETTIIIPNYARRVRFLRTDGIAGNTMPGPIVLETFATGIGASARSAYKILNVNETGPMDISQGDDQLGIINQSGVTIKNVRAVFELEL